jgi:AraC-like DNA-binding protein
VTGWRTGAARTHCSNVAGARSIAALRARARNTHGRARAEVVAKALAVNSRTLTRRLAAEGTNFAEVVDDLRRSLERDLVRLKRILRW